MVRTLRGPAFTDDVPGIRVTPPSDFKMTQREVAERLGISSTRVQQVEVKALCNLWRGLEADARESGKTLY